MDSDPPHFHIDDIRAREGADGQMTTSACAGSFCSPRVFRLEYPDSPLQTSNLIAKSCMRLLDGESAH